jgi:penicillin-binding protein 2
MSAPVIIAVAVLVCSLVALGVLAWKSRSGKRFSFDIGGSAPTASGGDATSAESGFASRIRATIAVVAVAFGAVAVRLWGMQIVDGDEYVHRAENNRTRTVATRAPRGRILDRNGVELVTNRPSLVVVSAIEVADDEVEIQLLANVLGMPPTAVRRNIQDQTEGAQSLRTVAVDVSRRVVSYIDEHQYLFEGVNVEERAQRHYPMGSTCAHVLGYTGSPTVEQLKAAEEDTSNWSIAYESGDTIGQAGIEYQYESVLQGVRGEQTVYVDADGSVLDYATSIEAQPGSDIVLTIDSKVQKVAE